MSSAKLALGTELWSPAVVPRDTSGRSTGPVVPAAHETSRPVQVPRRRTVHSEYKPGIKRSVPPVGHETRPQRNATAAASTATTPIIAGQPCTEPLKVTDHALMVSPAATPVFPFHFDHNETNPTNRKMAEATNSFRVLMAGYFDVNRSKLPTLVIVPRAE